jgi:pimeloyl-ACP methyl ester carboxylesterase
VHALLPSAPVVSIRGLGHLAHEEDPGRIAGVIVRLAAERGVLPAPVSETSHA